MFTLWPTVRLITWLILAMGRRVVAANFFIGLRIPKKLMKFLQLLAFLIFIQMIFSRYDNLEVDRLLLAQLVCDTIQSLCEYLMTYPSLMEEIFLKRTPGVGGGGILPTMAYTGRLRQKGIPYLAFRYMKGWDTSRSIWKSRKIYHFGL